MNTSRFLAAAGWTLAATLFCAGVAHAQIPFLALEPGAISAVEKVAKDTLKADDAILVSVSNIGLEILGQSTGINTSTGEAPLWIYSFYSPLKDATAGAAVTQLIGYQVQAGDTAEPRPVDMPIPVRLDTSGAFANSDKLVERLQTDTVFQRFVKDFPNRTPFLSSLGDGLETSFPGPEGFPTGQPTWVLLWSGEGDSTMYCLEATRTGEVFCQRLEIPAAAPMVTDAAREATMLSVQPNPAVLSARVSIAPRDGAAVQGIRSAILFDGAGRKVLDLTQAFARNDNRFADLDAAGLPPGLYFVHVTTERWSSTVPVTVGAR